MLLHQDGKSGVINIQNKRTDILIECHLADCKARLSPFTVKNHRVCLNAFMKFINGKEMKDVTKNDVRMFLKNMK